VFETTGKENKMPTGLWSMNRPENSGAVPWKRRRGRRLVNLIGRACIKRVEASVLVDRMVPSGSGPSNK